MKVVTLNDVKMGITKNPYGGLLKGNTEDVLLFGVHIRTLLHDKINPKDCQVLFLDDFSGFSNFSGLFQVMTWQFPAGFSMKKKSRPKDLDPFSWGRFYIPMT